MEPYILDESKTHHLDEDNTHHFQIFGGWYNEWRRVRVNKLEEVLGTDWNGKDVLEVGAGFGNIGLYFKAKGAEVVFADANDKCREIIISKDSEANVYEINNDFKWNIPFRFDLIIHFGLSYNLQHWKRDLTDTIRHLKDQGHIVFETAVNKFQGDIEFEIRDYKPHHWIHGPAEGVGSLPSVTSIENFLDQFTNISYTRYDDPSLNIHNFKYTDECTSSFVSPKDDNGKDMKGPFVVDGWDNEYVTGGRKYWIIKKGI